MDKQPPKPKEIAQNMTDNDSNLKIVSFNCKGAKVNWHTISQLIKNNDLVLLQEPWLFQAQIDTLVDLETGICYVGKGIDKYEQLTPQYLPRGFGGVAVIWKDGIDSKVKPLEEGRERIQCVEIQTSKNKNFLAISVYLPAVGSRNHEDEYKDAIDQLYEILQKYQNTHEIMIGGDLNEDLANYNRRNKRKDYLQQFILELGLTYTNCGKTFLRPNGEECSELDYFLWKMDSQASNKIILKDIISNTSDHYPIRTEVRHVFTPEDESVNSKEKNMPPSLKWDKVDQDMYEAMINDQVDDLLLEPLESIEDADVMLQRLHRMLKDSAYNCTSRKTTFKSRPKLKV